MQIYVQTQTDKKMPALASLLEPDDLTPNEAPKVQSYEEQKAALYMLSGMFGGKVVELNRSV